MQHRLNLHAEDLYMRLALLRGASREEIKKAYLRLLREYPPERHPEEFKRLREAYEVLYDPKSRKEYDEQPDPHVRELVQQAIAAMDAEEYDAAERLFKQALIEAPALDYARNLLGLCFLYQHQPHKAIQQYERLVEKGDVTAAMYGNGGHAYLLAQQYAIAETWFERAIHAAVSTKQPPVDYFIGLADTYVVQEKLQAAKGLLRRGIELDGKVDFDDLRYFTKLLEIALKERDLAEAQRVLQLNIQIAQDDEQRRYLAWKLGVLAQQLILAAEPGFAKHVASAARVLQPEDPDYAALAELALHLAAHRFDNARRVIGTQPSFAPGGWLENFGKVLHPRLPTADAEPRGATQRTPAITPVVKPPPLYTVNGIGTKLYGCRDKEERSGSYVTTLYATVLFVPLIPLAAYRVIEVAPGRYRFLEKVPLSVGASWHFGLVAVSVLLLFVRGMAPTPVDYQSPAMETPAVRTALATPDAGAVSERTGLDIDGLYEGTVVNSAHPGGAASLRLEVSTTGGGHSGFLRIGPPLGGSGPFVSQLEGDTISLLTASLSGDTIAWIAQARDKGYRGQYVITGGPYQGQGGKWEVAHLNGKLISSGRSPDLSFDIARLLGVARQRIAEEACVAAPIPASGTEFKRAPRDGLGRLAIRNGTPNAAYAALVDAGTGSTLRSMVIRPGEEAAFTKVRPGVYRLRFLQGSGWTRTPRRFCTRLSASEFESPMVFEEIESEDGTKYDQIQVTLHPVAGGTARTRPMDPELVE